VSHDLKNPIQVVQLGATLLEMDGPLNESQLDRIMIIQRSAQQLSNLVTDVLDLARLEAGPSLRLVLLNLEDVIKAALLEMEHLAAQKRQRMRSEAPADLPVLLGDQVLLTRVLTNLLSNAIKYTPDGGTITVYARADQQTVEIDVADTGPGIPAEALPHLFERFYRVPGTQGEGTGLGLSIVKSIIEKHGGSVRASSTPGRGSLFTLMLPLNTDLKRLTQA
jgi:signal transduction histidine kinase